MDIREARSGAKALYLQAASLSGLEVSPTSPEALAGIVAQGFDRVAVDESNPSPEAHRRPEAVANLLRLIAASLQDAQDKRAPVLQEAQVEAGRESVCPVYPFN
jgi:hypothetical protein